MPVATKSESKSPDATSRVAKKSMTKAEKEKLQKSSEALSGNAPNADVKATVAKEKAEKPAKRDVAAIAEDVFRTKVDGPLRSGEFMEKKYGGLTPTEEHRLYLAMKNDERFVKIGGKAVFDLAELNPEGNEYRPGHEPPPEQEKKPAAKAKATKGKAKASGSKGTTTPVKQRESARSAAKKATEKKEPVAA